MKFVVRQRVNNSTLTNTRTLFLAKTSTDQPAAVPAVVRGRLSIVLQLFENICCDGNDNDNKRFTGYGAV